MDRGACQAAVYRVTKGSDKTERVNNNCHLNVTFPGSSALICKVGLEASGG